MSTKLGLFARFSLDITNFAGNSEVVLGWAGEHFIFRPGSPMKVYTVKRLSTVFPGSL